MSEKKSNWKELVFEIGLIVVFLAVKNRNGQEILLDTLLLILGAKEIASEKLIRVYTVTIATALFEPSEPLCWGSLKICPMHSLEE